jgi:hypothetical protein
MHCGFCFLCCTPEAGRQSFVDPNCYRSTAAGLDDPTSGIVIASGIINSLPGHPSHQFG